MEQNTVEEINKLKKARKAVILAHNYQPGEIQDVADFVGDSLELSVKAQKTEASIIVFCGVLFMAQTAKLLSPEKTVLLPDLKASCPLANMVSADDIKNLRKKYPTAPVVSYVNTTARVKAESDICCTSQNAEKIVDSVKEDEIIFVPDRNLGRHISKRTKKKMHTWEGFCYVHESLKKEDLLKLKEDHPDAKISCHPECPEESLEIADHIGSTSGMLKFAKESENTEFIIGTEIGIIHRLKKENPKKVFYPASGKMLCKDMKRINLEKLHTSLKEMKHKIEISPAIREKAKKTIERMTCK